MLLTVKPNEVTINGLPKEFTPLILERGSFDHKEALKYLSKRNIKKDLIEKYNLGYAVTGDYKGRIIFPSYGCDGEINYFLGRSYSKFTKLKYSSILFLLKLFKISFFIFEKVSISLLVLLIVFLA